jgi:GTP pyrophosphokinase
MNLAEFIIKIESFNANVNIPLLRRAYEFSAQAHKGQYRESGDPYVEHCLEVAFVLAEQHMDSATIAAGLVHDVVEETDVSISQIRKEFGEEVAELVDGVTHISEVKFKSTEEKQVDYYRKMLLSMAKDIRVIIIKLADRLHNMRTLQALAPERRERISRETLDVYAPLAHRFGMSRIKDELEDLSLKYLKPEIYQDISEKLDLTREEMEKYIIEVTTPLKRELEENGIKAEISGRAKHFRSIYRKMVTRHKPFEDIDDLIAIRVIVNTEAECYQTLGIVHSLWTPVAERFDDYIATPKSNMYRSLHTTVVGPQGKMVEIQIRTYRMHRTAEYGVAAHWLYKEGRRKPDESDKQMIWLREVLEWQKDLTNPSEFLEYLKIDLFHDDIFVFTPRGDLKQLSKGSTPLDFAYAVHSDVGNRCIGAKVNGKMVPLNTLLKSGDRLEILTSPHQTPSQDWLKIVKTSRARSKIRRWLKQKGYEDSVKLGREVLEKEFKKNNIKILSEQEMNDLANSLNFSNVELMYAALGSGDVSIKQVLTRLLPSEEEKVGIVKKVLGKTRDRTGIKIQGMGNLMFRFAQCCQPLPGEEIVGFITKGRGVSIHRDDCPNALNMMGENDRRVDVEWDVQKDQSFLVRLEIMVEDRKGLLHDITKAIADADTNIKGAEIKPSEPPIYGTLIIEVKNLRHLNRTIKKIKRVKGVITVERAKGMEE